MNDSDNAANKFNRNTDEPDREVPLNNVEVLVELRRKKRCDTTMDRCLKKELQEMCNSHNIQTVKMVANIIRGCCNKPKGMLQILFER